MVCLGLPDRLLGRISPVCRGQLQPTALRRSVEVGSRPWAG